MRRAKTVRREGNSGENGSADIESFSRFNVRAAAFKVFNVAAPKMNIEGSENGSAGIESAQRRFAAAARSARQAVRHVMNWHGTFGGYFTGRHFGPMVLAHRQCAG